MFGLVNKKIKMLEYAYMDLKYKSIYLIIVIILMKKQEVHIAEIDYKKYHQYSYN